MDEVSDSRHHLFAKAQSRAEWSVQHLWLDYLALGGTRDAFDLDAYLEGLMPLGAAEQDVLAVALNERLHDRYLAHRVPYLLTVESPSAPNPGPVDILNELLADPPDDDP